jgi:hypothetical protein
MLDATQALTVIAPIDPNKRKILDDRLAAISEHPKTNEIFRPHELPYTHFMRFVVIPGDDKIGLPALLAWESNHDRSADTYIEAVLHSSPLERIFECCERFPRTVDNQVTWMLDHTVRASAFYTAYRGVPRNRVDNDQRVHGALRKAIDSKPIRSSLLDLPPTEIQRRLCEHVRVEHPDLDIRTPRDQEWRWWLGRILTGIGFVLALPFLLLIAGPWWLVLRHKERKDVPDPINRPVHDDNLLAEFEDQVTQNQLTHIVDIKPGWFRYTTLVTVMFAIDLLARIHFVRGNLAGITSIHFARWVIVKDRWSKGRKKRHRLLFFSNYDGSWESYLGEFVDRASNGLTGVWSNTDGFPRTRNLIRAGARDEEAFKQWARNHQIRTQVWWSGVPDSTVQNVLDDLWIRRYLDGGLPDDQVSTWLRKL